MVSSSVVVQAAPPQEVIFNNGSVLVLNPDHFTGSFQNMNQEKFNTGIFNWKFALVKAMNFGPTCPSAAYAVESMQASLSSCKLGSFTAPPVFVGPNEDGTGVKFSFVNHFPSPITYL